MNCIFILYAVMVWLAITWFYTILFPHSFSSFILNAAAQLYAATLLFRIEKVWFEMLVLSLLAYMLVAFDTNTLRRQYCWMWHLIIWFRVPEDIGNMFFRQSARASYKTTRRQTPEGCCLNAHGREPPVSISTLVPFPINWDPISLI